MSRLPRGVVPVVPGPGQESVWDYPRPPRVEPSDRRVVVELGGVVIVETVRALRLLETSHPPSWYLPLADVRPGVLVPVAGTTTCEFKGTAHYYDVAVGARRESRAAWTYPEPVPRYDALRGHVALYPGRMDRCTVDGIQVLPQEGGFYGGWVTPDVVGPFKGGPGSWGW